MSFKNIKSNAKRSLKSKYFKYFLISLVAFILSIELKIVLEDVHASLTGIVQISYLMALFGILIKPFYIVWLKKAYLTGSLKNKMSLRNYFKITTAFFIRKTVVLVGLFIFVLPGIVKAIQYIFVPYILADKEDITLKEAFDESSILTKGSKKMIFKFICSFLWQYIPAFLCFGIGVVFVNPYFEMCLKELYLAKKVNSGYVGDNNTVKAEKSA